jgi:hypothetical protein
MISGKTSAVISLGLSCQTEFQIRANKSKIEKLTGEEFFEFKTPFDWNMADPAGVALMLRDGKYFPKRPSEFSKGVTADGIKKPYWPDRSTWFWHVKAPWELASARMSTAKANFERIRHCRRRIFIVSNTQNNLQSFSRRLGGFDPHLGILAIHDFHNALTANFGPNFELHVVTRSNWSKLLRAGPVAPRPQDPWGQIFIHFFQPDRSQWSGDMAQWEKLFEKIFARDDGAAENVSHETIEGGREARKA